LVTRHSADACKHRFLLKVSVPTSFYLSSSLTVRIRADAWIAQRAGECKTEIRAIDASTGKAVTNFLRPPETLHIYAWTYTQALKVRPELGAPTFQPEAFMLVTRDTSVRSGLI